MKHSCRIAYWLIQAVLGGNADAFYQAWRDFDREIEATIALIKSTEDENRDLLKKLCELQGASAALFDRLMDNPVSLKSKAEVVTSKEATNARAAAQAASQALANRLTTLYRS